MELKSCMKVYQKETHRSKVLDETYENAAGLAEIAGITRVADITKLDRIGIPVFSCIRPEASEGAISVYNGKGATPLAAKVSAIMEGLERYSGEPLDREFTEGRFPELAGSDDPSVPAVLDPAVLILPEGADPDARIAWVNGFLIDDGSYDPENMDKNDEETCRRKSIGCVDVLIPADAVCHPVPKKYHRLFRSGTNGLASGNTIEEAVYHGLCEVIERDAWSLAEASKSAGKVIEDIDDPDINRLLDLFRNAGVDIILRDITSDIGVPTVAAVSDDIDLKDPALLCLGMGTHSSPKIAALRALTEVAQSRATQIHGAREDTTTADVRKQIGYERTKRLNAMWFDMTEKISFGDIKGCSHDDFLDEICETIQKLKAAGFSTVLFADLTRDDIKVPVVKVIIPGAECAAIDSERKGVRYREAQKRMKKENRPVRRYVPKT